MNSEEKIYFKKSESFYIREGWIEKAINIVAKRDDVFSKNNGVQLLGIGSNMVKGLKYWLSASSIIETNASRSYLTEFGSMLLKYDKYLEDTFSWVLIHYFLSTNYSKCPVFNIFFNSGLKEFTKESLSKFVIDFLHSKNYNNFLNDYVYDDVGIFVKSYVDEEVINNPEENNHCPLADLSLLKEDNKKYKRNSPKYSSTSPLIIYYSLTKCYENNNEFNIDDLFEKENNPLKIFNLDKTTFFQYIDDCAKRGLLKINKTADLNTIYLIKRLTLTQLFEKYFGGKK